MTIDEQGLLIVEVGREELVHFKNPCSSIDIQFPYEDAMNEKAFDLEDRLVDFAVRVIRMVEAMPDSKAG